MAPNRLAPGTALTLLGLLCPSLAVAQPRIINLGVLPDGAIFHGYAVSGSGSVVAGEYYSPVEPYGLAYRCSVEGGMQALGPLAVYAAVVAG